MSTRYIKKIYPLIASFFVATSCLAQEQKMPLLALTQIAQHPSLDEIRQGILDELDQQGFQDGKTMKVVYDNAQGSPVTATQIAKKFASLSPDAIVAITTPSAQTVLAATRGLHIPIIFGAVTDPVSAKIVKSLEKPGGSITGTTDLPPCKAQIALIQKTVPHIKTLGTLYNPGEANNAFQIGLLKAAAKEASIEIKEQTVTKTSEVYSGTQALMGKVDAILLLNDNTVISSIESLLSVTKEFKTPVFTSDPDSVKRGAVAAIANNQYDVGRRTGELVARVLRGESAHTIPINPVHEEKLYFNSKIAQEMGISFDKGIDVLVTEKNTAKDS